MEELLDIRFFGNPLLRWGIALLVAAAVIAALVIAKRLAVSRLAKLSDRTATRLDDVVVKVIEQTSTMTILVAGVAAGVRSLDLPRDGDLWLGRVMIIVLAIQVGSWITNAVRLLLETRVGVDVQPGQRTMGAALGFATNLVVWAVLVLLVLSNFGVEVSTLVAGLGIGGIAAALAVQNVLGDLFAAFSIYVDRPFDLGDFVIVDTYMGTVEKIGWRSTQLRSLSGEMIVLANSDLSRARIRNFKRMSERRAVVTFGVQYDTPNAKLAAIPGIVRQTIEAIEGLRFDRSHFVKLGESSLDFETVFYVTTPDFNAFADRQQQLLLSLHRRFEDEGISFAFPTRTVVVQREAPIEG
ncbi:mechanosensitive ion channel family protein [Sandaracinus amylolyticus]|uniref:Potassium efflux system KefA protein / Small-conductance mechanosensitive channel n=1 Tax=Sandaracinus amylolyticus TaxID=927083 RepID=A0A0F6YK54_9BACT|nr:mechanosensitive ion channel family protein [Sandaracinus amylolyticus]AKF08491.1 Potassium efflux system KefA protein / Small-conductance mechanosensitive channel [Sandaracinus amylolyticus]